MEDDQLRRVFSNPLIADMQSLNITTPTAPTRLPRATSLGTQVGALHEAQPPMPTRPSVTNNQPVGVRPPGNDSSPAVRRWLLSAQAPGTEVPSYTTDSEKLFSLPRQAMNYPEKVKSARPWFIASYRLSNNPRIHGLLFP